MGWGPRGQTSALLPHRPLGHGLSKFSSRKPRRQVRGSWDQVGPRGSCWGEWAAPPGGTPLSLGGIWGTASEEGTTTCRPPRAACTVEAWGRRRRPRGAAPRPKDKARSGRRRRVAGPCSSRGRKAGPGPVAATSGRAARRARSRHFHSTSHLPAAWHPNPREPARPPLGPAPSPTSPLTSRWLRVPLPTWPSLLRPPPKAAPGVPGGALLPSSLQPQWGPAYRPRHAQQPPQPPRRGAQQTPPRRRSAVGAGMPSPGRSQSGTHLPTRPPTVRPGGPWGLSRQLW